MSLTEQQEFRDGFLRGYMAGDQTIGGNIPTVYDCPGPPGDQGPQGPASTVTGPDGDPGLTGLDGPIGFDGDKGLTGTAGIDNFVVGPTGIDGLQGPVGESPIGDQGPPGVIGLDGSQQIIADFTMETDLDSRVTTLTNVSTIPNEVTTIGYNTGNMP